MKVQNQATRQAHLHDLTHILVRYNRNPYDIMLKIWPNKDLTNVLCATQYTL